MVFQKLIICVVKLGIAYICSLVLFLLQRCVVKLCVFCFKFENFKFKIFKFQINFFHSKLGYG